MRQSSLCRVVSVGLRCHRIHRTPSDHGTAVPEELMNKHSSNTIAFGSIDRFADS